jgi:AMP phosphorylase
LELCGKAGPGEGLSLAREVLTSGRAEKKFKEIVTLQGGKWVSPDALKLGKFSCDVLAPKKGVINFMSDDLVSCVARTAGAPLDKGAGIYIHKTVDEFVVKGEPVLTVYAESERLLDEAFKKCGKGLFTIK